MPGMFRSWSRTSELNIRVETRSGLAGFSVVGYDPIVISEADFCMPCSLASTVRTGPGRAALAWTSWESLRKETSSGLSCLA